MLLYKKINFPIFLGVLIPSYQMSAVQDRKGNALAHLTLRRF